MSLSPSRQDDEDPLSSGESSFAYIEDFDDDESLTSFAAQSSEVVSSGKPATQDDASSLQDEADQGTSSEATHDGLTFQIPKGDFRKAIIASENSAAAFWSCSLYKDSDGNGVKRHYCTTYEQTEEQAKNFLGEKVLGFDLEWESNAWPGKASAKRCVSLVQIASESRVGLFQIAMFKGDTAEELMPPSMRKILESPDIVKAGVNIGNDAGRVEKCLNVKMAGLVELSHLYKVVTHGEKEPHKVNRRLYKLADQAKEILHLPLMKGEVRVSAWSKRLNAQQVEYAANDAYAGFRLYHALEAKRKVMKPTPPRPAFWELHQPLSLGDGTTAVPRSARVTKQTPQQAEEKQQDDDDEADEFFDTAEDMDALDQVAASAGVPLAGIQVQYPSLPALEELTISDLAQASDATKKPVVSKSKLESEEAVTADRWAAQYRENHQPVRASQPTLRAYHLWHYQEHSPTQIAESLNLALNTVATYVSEAVLKQGLEYDVGRMSDVLDIIPQRYWYRYKAIVEKVKSGRRGQH